MIKLLEIKQVFPELNPIRKNQASRRDHSDSPKRKNQQKVKNSK